MEVHSACCKSVLLDVNSFHGLQSVDEKESELVNKLECSLRESLHVEDTQEFEYKRDQDHFNDGKDKHVCQAVKTRSNNSYRECLCECASATFSSPCVKLAPDGLSADGEESNSSFQQHFSDEPVNQTPPGLVSALKGSRAQHGGSPKKLTVKWAPDVYDPPQTLSSHTVHRSKKLHKSKNKKNGRRGQKSSSFGYGSISRSKRQVRKVVATSEQYYKSFDPPERLVDPFDDFEKFEIGSSDPFCGSSFLMQSVTKVHYSVAEAL